MNIMEDLQDDGREKLITTHFSPQYQRRIRGLRPAPTNSVNNNRDHTKKADAEIWCIVDASKCWQNPKDQIKQFNEPGLTRVRLQHSPGAKRISVSIPRKNFTMCYVDSMYYQASYEAVM